MVQTFIPLKTPKKQGLTLASTRQMSTKLGDIGIEIEVEGKRLPNVTIGVNSLTKVEVIDGFQKFWAYHPDGSLRGEENGEYVLRNPIKFGLVPDALKDLWDTFKECKTRIDDSNRTSVHVHLNCQQFHTNRLTSLMALYIIFEEILTAWCGDHRVGNLFCLRVKDAPAMLFNIRTLIQNEFAGGIPDSLHYSGMNVHALNKYGSLEFRSMRGTQDPDTILQWCKVLQRLYDLSAEFKDPREICYMFSGEGPVNFFHNILGDCTDFIRSGIPFTEQEVRQSMYEGIRLAQDLCYCRDWSAFEEVDLKKDPFGRSQNKVLGQLSYYSQEDALGQYTEPYDSVMDQHHGLHAPAPANHIVQVGTTLLPTQWLEPFPSPNPGTQSWFTDTITHAPAPQEMTQEELHQIEQMFHATQETPHEDEEPF